MKSWCQAHQQQRNNGETPSSAATSCATAFDIPRGEAYVGDLGVAQITALTICSCREKHVLLTCAGVPLQNLVKKFKQICLATEMYLEK